MQYYSICRPVFLNKICSEMFNISMLDVHKIFFIIPLTNFGNDCSNKVCNVHSYPSSVRGLHNFCVNGLSI